MAERTGLPDHRTFVRKLPNADASPLWDFKHRRTNEWRDIMYGTYNDLLDSDEVHNDDITVVGTGAQIPLGMSESGIPFGGHQSTAVDAVNFIRVDRQAIVDRNLSYLRERIALSKMGSHIPIEEKLKLLSKNSVKENISSLQ